MNFFLDLINDVTGNTDNYYDEITRERLSCEQIA